MKRFFYLLGAALLLFLLSAALCAALAPRLPGRDLTLLPPLVLAAQALLVGFGAGCLRPERWGSGALLAAGAVWLILTLFLLSCLPRLLTCAVLGGAAAVCLTGAGVGAFFGGGFRRALASLK